MKELSKEFYNVVKANKFNSNVDIKPVYTYVKSKARIIKETFIEIDIPDELINIILDYWAPLEICDLILFPNGRFKQIVKPGVKTRNFSTHFRVALAKIESTTRNRERFIRRNGLTRVVVCGVFRNYRLPLRQVEFMFHCKGVVYKHLEAIVNLYNYKTKIVATI